MDAVMQAVSSCENGTTVFVYTNARAKDSDLAPAVSSLASAKNVKIFPALFGSCSPYDPAFYQLAEATGGQVFVMDPKEAETSPTLADATARSGRSAPHRGARRRLASKEIVFTTDPTITQLTIAVSNEVESPEDLAKGAFVTSSVESPGGDVVSRLRPNGTKLLKLGTGLDHRW